MTEHAPHDTPAAAPHADHRRDYFRVFWVLLVLTIVEVGVSYVRVDKRLVSAVMVGLALSKAAFVGLFYMHLRYETKALQWLAFLPLPLAAFYGVFLMLDGANLMRPTTLPWVHP
jgi:caa(3)-type oxidase subunit IV